jgi:hypothetical protein
MTFMTLVLITFKFPCPTLPKLFPVSSHMQPHLLTYRRRYSLRNLFGRFLNNPDTLVNMLRIEPGTGGRFVAWIELELADICRVSALDTIPLTVPPVLEG